jgi:hypothetical protein
MEKYKILNPETAVLWLFLRASSVSGRRKVEKRLCIFDRLSSFASLGIGQRANCLAEMRGTIIAGCSRIG